MGKKGGGGGGTTSTVQSADPWIGAQSHLLDLYGQSSNWMHNTSTVAPMGSSLGTGLSMLGQRARAGSPTIGLAQNKAQRLMTGGGMQDNPWTSGEYNNNNSWSRGDGMRNNPWATGQMGAGNIYSQGWGWNTNNTAQGAMLDKGNPYLDQMVNAASRPIVENFQKAIAPSLASQFSLAGRTGSGSHVAAFDSAAGTLGRQLSDTSSNLHGQAYNLERGFMEQAAEAERQRRYGAYQGEQDKQMQAWMGERGMQFNATEADRQRNAQAVEMERARMMQALGMSPGLAQADYMDAQQMINAGQLERGIAQEFMSEPEKKLGLYAQIMGGAAPYGTNSSSGSQSQQQPYNKLTGTIGGGLGGYALANAMFPGFGMVGGALGALGGLFG